MKKNKSKKSKIKNWYKSKFPHIPFLLVFILFLISFSIVLIEYLETKTFSGIGFNIATEIIGILITVLLVDFYIRKKQEKDWERIHSGVRASLLGLLMGFDTLLLFMLKKIEDEKLKEGNIYKALFDNMDSVLSKINEEELKSTVNQLGEIVSKHIEKILSDIKLNPKPDYINEIIGIRNQANFLATLPNLNNSPILKNFTEKESLNKFIVKSFKTIIYNLSEIDKRLLFEYPKIKPVPTEFLSYLAFNKAMGIKKDIQDARDIILSKTGLENVDELFKKFNKNDSETDNRDDKD